MYEIDKLATLGECLLIEAEKDPVARPARIKQARRALEAADFQLENLYRDTGVTEELSKLRKRINNGISRCLALASPGGKLFPFKALFDALEEAEMLLSGALENNVQLHRALDAINRVEHSILFHQSSGHELPETIGERIVSLRGYAEQLTV